MAFKDFSKNNFEITAFGNAKISTAQKKYGDGSAYFDGNGDYLQTTISNSDWSPGVGNKPFTIEFWVYIIGSGTQVMLAKHGGANAWNGTNGLNFNFYVTSSSLIFGYYAGSENAIINNSIPNNQWVHLAIVYNGTVTKIFVDGVEQPSTSNTGYTLVPLANTLEIGSQINGGFPFQGYIDDLRITDGIARYTSTFTPPAAQLPTIVDPNYSNVLLLLPMNLGPFKDSSTNNFELTAVGNTDLSKSIVKYGTAAVYFDGSGDYLRTVSSNEFNFGNGPFTIEMWVNPNPIQVTFGGANGNAGAFVSTRISAVHTPIEFSIKTDLKIQLLAETTGGGSWQSPIAVTSNTALTADVWSHIALVYDGTNTKLYINGILDSNFTSLGYSYKNQYNSLYIGSGGDGNFNGYIDDLRITKGIARYTSNFTPPQQQLPTPSDPYQNNVQLLLHMDGTNGSQTFTDSSSNNFTLSAFGDAQISTSVKKFGTGSAAFDGNGDYLELPLNSAFDFGSGDFTIECWFYTTKVGFQTLVARWSGGNNAFFLGTDTSTPNIQLYINGFLACIGGTPQLNQWNHIAAIRNSADIKLFLNGIQVGNTFNIGNTPINTTTNKLRIGFDNGGNPYFEGYIDELRITKGVARYTSNFVPHTAPFVNPPILIPSGYLAFWKLADLTDSSPNGNNLINTGNVQFVAGKVGDCAQFNGSNTLVSNLFTPTFNAGQPFSVAFWANPTSNALGTLVGAQGTNTFNIHNNSDGSMSFNNAASGDVSIAGAFQVGVWKHYVCIVSGGRNKVYINGILVYNQPSGVTYSATSTTIGIGRYPGGTTLPFQGLIDSVGIWQRELTQSEINLLYNNGNGREP